MLTALAVICEVQNRTWFAIRKRRPATPTAAVRDYRLNGTRQTYDPLVTNQQQTVPHWHAREPILMR